MALDDVERGHIQHVLEVCDWNQTRAAKALGIDRVTLYNKIKKYGFKKADAAAQSRTFGSMSDCATAMGGNGPRALCRIRSISWSRLWRHGSTQTKKCSGSIMARAFGPRS